MTNYRSRIADELLRASHGIVYRRIWRGLGDGALPDDVLTTTISKLTQPVDRRERRIGQRRTIYAALWTLYNLRLIDVKTSGRARQFRYHIALLRVSDRHEEQLLHALRRTAVWGRKRRAKLVQALERGEMTAEAWGHVAPAFCGDQMKTHELVRPRQLTLLEGRRLGGFPTLPVHTENCAVSQCSMERILVCTGTQDLCSGTEVCVHRRSLDPRSAAHYDCQNDFSGSSPGLFGKGGRMSEYDGIDELPDGEVPPSKWGKRKIPSRKVKPTYVPPSVDEVAAPAPVEKKPLGRPITADLELDTAAWPPAQTVIPEIEALFRERIDIGRSGTVYFYGNDRPPKAFLRELYRIETPDTYAGDPRVKRESLDAPVTVLRVLRHFYRLHDGQVADAHAVANANHLADRLRDYGRNACRLSTLQMVEVLAGYAHTASTRIAERKPEYLPSRAPDRIWSRQGYYTHIATWEALVAKGVASDPWAYLDSLPDGCCSIKFMTDSSAKESKSQAALRELLARYEEACRQHEWEKTHDAEHGAGAFKALSMVERIQLVMGMRTAVKYEVLIEETTTNDPPETHLGTP